MSCPITMEQIEFPKTLECNHTFEMTAIEQWLADNNTCPVCRYKVYEKETPMRPTLPEGLNPDIDIFPSLPIFFEGVIDIGMMNIASVSFSLGNRTIEVSLDDIQQGQGYVTIPQLNQIVHENFTLEELLSSAPRSLNIRFRRPERQIVHETITREELDRMTASLLREYKQSDKDRMTASLLREYKQSDKDKITKEIRQHKKPKYNKHEHRMPKHKFKNKFR